MPRKRKVPVVDEEKENDGELSQNSTIHHGPMYTIMSNVQLNETFHKKYIREMQQLYGKMDHDAFMFTFIKMIKSAMEGDETNEYAYTTLLFCAKFIAAYDVDDTHPVLVDTFRWLLSTISQNPHIRFRLCQFVNQILNALGVEAALDDAICDRIMEYMVRRLRDINPNVRVQAILALQRLQIPDNPDDIVLRVYQFHLSSDPSPRVRQAVITSMGRNYNTIPYILDRLWDIDEKVRRHTYLHMSGYPVKAYKVSQRLQLLEQGLNDRSEMVKKVVTTIMLPQWLESYNKNYITFVSALKLDSSEAEVERFMKIAKVALKEIFKRQSRQDLINCIPLEEDGEFHKCVPHEKLTMEVTLYWQCLIEHLQTEMADELDMIIPELSTFCAYVLRFCESQKVAVDKFVKIEFQYVLLALCEILYLYDLGDEIGRENLKKLITTILKSNDLSEKIVEVIVKCTENLITDQNSRLQFFVDIIEEISSFNSDILNDRTLVAELLGKHPDETLELKLSSLKVKILGLREEEMNYVEQKDYVQAHRITEEKNACTEEYTNLVKSLLEKHSLSDENSGDQSKSLLSCFQETKKITPETIIKCLQLAFYMVVSKNVRTLTPNVCQLYKNFIGLHIASTEIAIRDWALKCGTAYSMLYESLAKEIYEVLYAQFLKNNSIRIWKTAITCIFELLDRYGCSSFNVEERQNKTKRNGRQLYNTILDADDDSSVGSGQAVDIIFMMSHFLDTCEDVCIISAIVNGFCRLVLHDHINSPDILEKLLLRYFNPSTDAEVNQILGVFLENLIQRKKQEYLHPCLLPTVSQVISAPYESPLHEIKPETVLRFVIDATRPEFCVPNANIHNKLALSFLQEMKNNFANKDLCKILAKELLTLQMSVQDDVPFKENLKTVADNLITCEFDAKTLKNIINFKDLLDGVFNPPPRRPNLDGSDDEDKSDDETVSAITTEREFDKQSSNDAALHRLDAVAEEDKESGAENESETGVQPSSQQNENEKESETEKDKEAETEPPPKTPAVSTPTQPQRSPTTPTTFGRENSTGLRYLRKSMNFTRQKSATDEGPSPKIRIEARIDSIPNVSPPKVQKMNENNARAKRRNLRGAPKSPVRAKSPVPAKSAVSTKSPVQTKSPVRAKTPVPAGVDKEQSTNKPGQPTRRKRKTAATKPTKGQQSKEKDSSSAEDTDDSEAIPPSPTSSSTTAPASSARNFSVRVNRTLRYNNNTQAPKPTTPAKSKGARSTRNNTTANPPAESVRLPKSPEPITRNTRKRPMSPNTPNKNNEGDKDYASPLRKQSKTSVNLSETTRNGSIANKLSTTTAAKPQTPVTNKLRAKNSNVPETPTQLQKSTRAAQSKAGSSPSSKENEPKSPVKSAAAYSSSSSAEESSSSSSEEEHKTPSQQKDSRFAVTKSIERRITSSKNPVLALRRSNLSPPATRVSTRNSARKDRQNNMIMTRKRLSLENVRGSPKSPKSSKSLATSKASSTQHKKPNAASSLASKFSKIPVNIALRTNKSNMTADKAKPQSSKSTRSEETSEMTSDSSSDSSSEASTPRKPTKEVPKATRNTSSSTTMQRTKPALLTARIARSTRNLNAKTMLRKRNI